MMDFLRGHNWRGVDGRLAWPKHWQVSPQVEDGRFRYLVLEWWGEMKAVMGAMSYSGDGIDQGIRSIFLSPVCQVPSIILWV
jgi:hypothetical protein